MSSIDERVVDMKFNNQQFERGVSSSVSLLDRLKAALKLDGAHKGLENVSNAAKNVKLDSVAAGADTIGSRFSAMSVVAVTALATIAHQAVVTGGQLLNSFTLGPIKSGFDEYELTMSSIQTILSNTARYGTKLPEVTKNLQELNDYADKTIYNFGDMTKNIGLFTNAGIKVGDATSMIKGFSNEAAASGTSAQGAASAAYQLSQALSAGKVTLMDWRSLQNVGMGNKNMQKGILDIAIAMGQVEKGGKKAKEITKDFNGSLKDGWLSADVMSKYLKIMAGDYSVADMKAMGLTNTQIKQFQIQQKNAEEAATKVRTFTQLTGTIRESIGSGWSETFGIIIGDFNSATKLWTGVNDTLGGLIGGWSKARNDLLRGWDKLGGRKALIDGLANAWQALVNLVKPIRDAFRSVFPATTAKQLADATKGFRDFMGSLKMGPENMDRLKRTFEGIFSILRIGWDILKGVVGFFTSLFSVAQGGGGSFLSLTATVGDFLVQIRNWIEMAGGVQSFFNALQTGRDAVLKPLIKWVGLLVDAFTSLVHGDVSGFMDKLKASFSAFAPLVETIRSTMDRLGTSFKEKFAQAAEWISNAATAVSDFLKSTGNAALAPIIALVDRLGESFQSIKDRFANLVPKVDTSNIKTAASNLAILDKASSSLTKVWDGLTSGATKIGNIVGPILESLGEVFSIIKEKVIEYVKDMDMQEAIALLNTGFFIAMYSMLRSFLKNLKGLVGDLSDMIKSISGVFDQLTSTLKTMQQNVKANIILKIAIAVGILVAAMYTLAQLDTGQLVSSLVAIGTLMTMLGITMKVISKIEPADNAKLVTMGASMILLSVAIKILASAVKDLSGLSWEEMAKGLIATGVLLGALTLFTKFAETDKASIKGAVTLLALAGAIWLLSQGVQKLGEMDTAKLVQGGIAVTALLVALGAVSKYMGDPKQMAGAAAIIALAGAIAVLAPVLIALGYVPYEPLIKGLGAVGILLGMLAIASAKMGDPKSAAGAAGILALAGALAIMTPVLVALGLLPYEVLIKGLAAVGIALGMFAIASQAMGNPMALKGAAGVLAMAAALAVLTPIILILGNTPWQVLALGLIALAAGLGIVLLAGALAVEVAPGLAILAVTILALGAAMALAGAGFLMFATGFAALAAIGAAGFAVLIAGFEGILNLLPLFAQQLGLAVIAFAKVISDAGPVLVEALTVVLISILKAIQNAAPQFFSTMATLIMGLVNTVTRLIPQLAEAGARMILRLLDVIGRYVGPMADKATKLMVEFIRAIGRNVPKLVDAGMKAVIDLVNGIADAIDNNSAELGRAGGNLARSIVQGIIRGITNGIGEVGRAAVNLAKSAFDGAMNFLKAHSPSRLFMEVGGYIGSGLAIGMDKSDNKVSDSAEGLGQTAINAMRKTIDGLAEAVESNVDVTPVIRPVLDLDGIRKDAGGISDILGSGTVGAYSRSNAISAIDGSGTPTTAQGQPALVGGPSVTFIQNNTSPKALSNAEIYRQSNNQLSRVKGAIDSAYSGRSS